MRFGIFYFKRLALVLCLCIAIAPIIQCAKNTGGASAANLPGDILGINIGMNKADAVRRLEEVAVFERDERKRQQVWRTKDEARFSHVAVGYDEKERVRYITAFVDKAKATERLRFSDIGDLSAAKKEIVEPHQRYIWDVPAKDGKPAYMIVANGDEPELVSIYSLSRANELKEDSKVNEQKN
jgi:hypothetical protein